MLCLALPHPEDESDSHLKFLITILFLALFHRENESDFFAIFFSLCLSFPCRIQKVRVIFQNFSFFATLPFLAYLIQKEALSIKSSCHFYQLHVFCHRPRNHPHNQGSGVELELGDSTSLEWEEEFVLAAQRSFRYFQKMSLHLNNQVIK